MINTELLPKTKSHAFGKDCYLIGRDKCGDLIWLEAAKWECGWYWGFGYIEVYTNQKNPSKARDISSHSHWDDLVGKQDDGSYKHHVNEVLQESVLTDSEAWELSDLMESFYTLKKTAELVKNGGSHLSGSGNRDYMKAPDLIKQINEVMLPKLFKDVYAILGYDHD